MKKIVIISVLAAVVISSAAGCSGSPPAENSQAESVVSSAPAKIEQSSAAEESSKGITALYVSPDSCKIKISEKRLLSVRSDSGAQLSSDLVWSCDDESIATVDSSGNVIGKAEGNCVITVSRRDQPSVTAKVPITVQPDEKSAAVQESSVQTSQASTESKPAQTSAESKPEQPSADSNGENTTIIYVTPPSGSVSYYVPRQYTYYYGRNNFSYDNPADGYVINSMLNHYLTRQELSMITKSDAQMMLNALYARNGYIFTNTDLQAYFETQTWYNAIPYYQKSGNMSTASSKFDSMDKANCDLLVAKRDGNL